MRMYQLVKSLSPSQASFSYLLVSLVVNAFPFLRFFSLACQLIQVGSEYLLFLLLNRFG